MRTRRGSGSWPTARRSARGSAPRGRGWRPGTVRKRPGPGPRPRPAGRSDVSCRALRLVLGEPPPSGHHARMCCARRGAGGRGARRAAVGRCAAESRPGPRAPYRTAAGRIVLQHRGHHRVPAACQGPARQGALRARVRVPAGGPGRPGRRPDEPGAGRRRGPPSGADQVRLRPVRPGRAPAAPAAGKRRGRPAGPGVAVRLLVYLPLLIPALAAIVSRPLAARLEPREATWLLTAATVALAGCSTVALALLAASAAARAPALATLGHYSPGVVHRADPTPAVIGAVAVVVLTMAAVAVAVTFRYRARALAESYRRAARLQRR